MANLASEFGKIPKQGYLLSLCQGLGITAAVIAVTVSALAGKSISGSSILATIPYGFQFLAIILLSFYLSILMEKIGRKKISFYLHRSVLFPG